MFYRRLSSIMAEKIHAKEIIHVITYSHPNLFLSKRGSITNREEPSEDCTMLVSLYVPTINDVPMSCNSVFV